MGKACLIDRDPAVVLRTLGDGWHPRCG